MLNSGNCRIKESKLKAFVRQIYFLARNVFIRCFFWPVCRKGSASIQKLRIKEILLIRIDRIGDLVVSLPALKLLRDIFPSARITFLVKKGNQDFLKYVKEVDEIIIYSGWLKTIGQLRKRKFDLAIDLLMDYPLKTALLATLSKAEVTVGFGIAGRGCLFNMGPEPAKEKKHISQHMLDLIKGIAGSDFSPTSAREAADYKISLPEIDRENMRIVLREKGIADNLPLIVVHPGGHYPSQRWPVDRFAKLVGMMIDRHKVNIVIVGSMEDSGLIDELTESAQKNIFKMVGLPLDKLTSLISLARIFIGNNSGPLHIACALGIPTVSTMGPTDPVLWWPRGENNIVIRKDLPCSPCNRPACGIRDCMRLITVEEMLEAAEKQIERVK